MSISCDVNLTSHYSQSLHGQHIAIIASGKFQYHPTLASTSYDLALPNLWSQKVLSYKSIINCWTMNIYAESVANAGIRVTLLWHNFVTYQDDCGIQTGPDLFSTYPTTKRKTSDLAIRDYGLTTHKLRQPILIITKVYFSQPHQPRIYTSRSYPPHQLVPKVITMVTITLLQI